MKILVVDDEELLVKDRHGGKMPNGRLRDRRCTGA